VRIDDVHPSTAPDDLLGIEEGKINDTRLYRCLDRLLTHKTKLERHLTRRHDPRYGLIQPGVMEAAHMSKGLADGHVPHHGAHGQ